MKETYTIISVGVALALVIVVNGNTMRQDIRDVRQEIVELQTRVVNVETRVSVIEAQLAMLIEAWDIEKLTHSTIAGK